MTEEYLIDTSALVRFFRGQTGPQWGDAVAAGLVGLCEPVRQEYLRAVGGKTAFYEASQLLHEIFPYRFVPDDAWQETRTLQDDLARISCHQSAGTVDLVVAVTAAHHKLTLLHEDGDFETIARVTGQATRRISSVHPS